MLLESLNIPLSVGKEGINSLFHMNEICLLLECFGIFSLLIQKYQYQVLGVTESRPCFVPDIMVSITSKVRVMLS